MTDCLRLLYILRMLNRAAAVDAVHCVGCRPWLYIECHYICDVQSLYHYNLTSQ